MELLLIYALLTILVSFLCSILEAVLLSINPTYISVKLGEGHKFANTLEGLKKNIDEPLIIILTLNTIAHTVGAILVGVQAKVVYSSLGRGEVYHLLGVSFSEEGMVGIVSAIMTVLILLLSEIIPKTLGATYWKKLAKITALFLRSIIPVFKYSGVLWFLQLFTKILGKRGETNVMSREDFSAMAEIAQQEGVIEEKESTVIKNMVRLNEVRVRNIMTPRSVMKIAPEQMSIQTFFDQNPKLRFSRIPVHGDNPEIITGYVLKDNVLEELLNKKGEMPLSDIKRELIVVNRDTRIPQIFETLMTKREHIALVVDEYGTVTGLVTMEDVIETLLGIEIMDESDHVEDLQAVARKKWEERAKKIGIIN